MLGPPGKVGAARCPRTRGGPCRGGLSPPQAQEEASDQHEGTVRQTLMEENVQEVGLSALRAPRRRCERGRHLGRGRRLGRSPRGRQQRRLGLGRRRPPAGPLRRRRRLLQLHDEAPEPPVLAVGDAGDAAEPGLELLPQQPGLPQLRHAAELQGVLQLPGAGAQAQLGQGLRQGLGLLLRRRGRTHRPLGGRAQRGAAQERQGAEHGEPAPGLGVCQVPGEALHERVAAVGARPCHVGARGLHALQDLEHDLALLVQGGHLARVQVREVARQIRGPLEIRVQALLPDACLVSRRPAVLPQQRVRAASQKVHYDVELPPDDCHLQCRVTADLSVQGLDARLVDQVPQDGDVPSLDCVVQVDLGNPG
mmetsp:Transcript_4926/g.11337  ORF Transcript_4926/g.11337 Transcript_4926/m.11337 type:complete len:366 (+) Transcript_4926:242-1339(+)